jgi:hypothetical protein
MLGLGCKSPIFAAISNGWSRKISQITVFLMKNWQKFYSVALLSAAVTLTGCLNILEEVSFSKNGSGTYSMMVDMSAAKEMIEMMKGMTEGQDAGGTVGEINLEDENSDPPAPTAEGQEPAPSNDMSQMGDAITGGIKEALKGIDGITNVVEIADTTNFKFGYHFDFASVEALNKAIKVINKEKYDAKADETFRFNGKKFERIGAANIGEELKKALSGEEEGNEEMEMVKTFFSDMSYTQVYRFKDNTVKKSSNSLSQVSEEGHTLTITTKPFSEDPEMMKAGIATEVKLK